MNMTTITFRNTLKDNLQVKIHIRNLLPLPKEKDLKKIVFLYVVFINLYIILIVKIVKQM